MNINVFLAGLNFSKGVANQSIKTRKLFYSYVYIYIFFFASQENLVINKQVMVTANAPLWDECEELSSGNKLFHNRSLTYEMWREGKELQLSCQH